MIQFSEKTDKNVLVRGVQNLAFFFISVLSIEYNEFTYVSGLTFHYQLRGGVVSVVRVESP